MIAEAVLLSAVVFGPLAFGATERWSVIILEAMLFALPLLCLRYRAIQWSHPALRTVLLGVVAILSIGCVQFLNPLPVGGPAGVLPFTADKSATGRAIFLWSAYAALLIGSANAFTSRDAVRRLLWTVFVLGAVISIIGLIQRGQGNAAYYGLRPIRTGIPFGPYTNYNHAASMLVLAAFSGAALWISRLELIRRIEDTGKRLEAWTIQALIGFFIGVIIYSIVFIRSRGAMHSMAISAALVSGAALYRFAGRTGRIVGGAALAAALAGYGFYMSSHRGLIGFEKSAPSSALFRLALFDNSLEIARDYPIFGVGLSSYDRVYPVYQDRNLIDIRVDHVHNDWLELLIETGLVGFVAYVGAFFAFYRRVLLDWFAAGSFEVRCMLGGILAATFSFCIHGLVDFSFHIPANAVLFLTLLVGAASFPAARAAPRGGR